MISVRMAEVGSYDSFRYSSFWSDWSLFAVGCEFGFHGCLVTPGGGGDRQRRYAGPCRRRSNRRSVDGGHQLPGLLPVHLYRPATGFDLAEAAPVPTALIAWAVKR
jgi:hypothetical protein